jgi:hypothetical protein
MISAYKAATLARNRENKTFLVGHSSELNRSTHNCHRENLGAITGILSDMAEI